MTATDASSNAATQEITVSIRDVGGLEKSEYKNLRNDIIESVKNLNDEVTLDNYLKINKNLIPLGGISINNLNSLNNINCQGFAMLSEIKKKPAKIFSRLF